MNANLSNRFSQIARAYWQPLVLAVLMLLVLSQVYSWGVAAIELSKVDTLIEQAEDTSPPDVDGEKPKTPGTPGPAPGNLPKGKEPPKKPAKNIFKKEQANYKLTAIYMNKAVINGQAVEVGGKVGKATIKEISIWDVTIEVDGQTRKLEMFKSGGSGPSSGGMRGRPPSRSKSPRRSSSNKPGMKNQKVQIQMGGGMRPVGPPAGFRFRGMSMEQIKNMSPDERRQMFQNITPEEREQMRSMRGGRGGGGGRGRD